ncbi:U8-agatoxin-Ao1a-like isoform X2 [Rhodnius prolixus]|uniref:Putative spider toxin domain protein n=1 Tax=Rhodnius prolixus TaxID=13249 RepID=R4FQK4_RHOPR
MRFHSILFGCFLALIIVLTLPDISAASPASYFDDDGAAFEDYSEADLENILDAAQKRGCVRRGGNCDHRPGDCCNNSTCRCNLWGANCRCQRKGLFQKWGK